MRKQLLLIALLATFICFKAAAQESVGYDKRTNVYGVETRTNAFEIGAEYLMPAGNFGNTYSKGYGAAIRYRFGISQFKSLLASVGYNTFSGDVALPGNPQANLHANFIPVKVGVKFGLSNYVYLAGELGTSISTGVSGVDNVNEYVKDSYRIKGALFNFAPSFGLIIPSKNKNYIDLSVRYEGFSYKQNVNFFTAVRAAYAFNIAR